MCAIRTIVLSPISIFFITLALCFHAFIHTVAISRLHFCYLFQSQTDFVEQNISIDFVILIIFELCLKRVEIDDKRKGKESRRDESKKRESKIKSTVHQRQHNHIKFLSLYKISFK